MTMPHDSPTSAQLLESVREWIEGEVMTGARPPSRFHARVAANLLAIVEREIELGPQQAVRHGARLDELGLPDDVALAAAIRSGQLDERLDQVRALVWESVRDKLRVANPAYLDRTED